VSSTITILTLTAAIISAGKIQTYDNEAYSQMPAEAGELFTKGTLKIVPRRGKPHWLVTVQLTYPILDKNIQILVLRCAV